MKFHEMPYERPDLERCKAEYAALIQQLKQADSYEKARAVFLAWEQAVCEVNTNATLASIRHSINTKDAFYDAEEHFWNEASPELQEYGQQWDKAMLESPFRSDFERKFGSLYYINAELAQKEFSPEIIPQLQQENDLTQQYMKCIASAQIPFEGKVYTISQMAPLKNDPDDSRRLAAWKAEGAWYKENQQELDEIYDKLVHLRHEMGRKMGHPDFTPLGYCRMVRNCYTKEDVEKFRSAVVKYLVPIADGIYREQAKRIGKTYPMSFADCILEFRSGNAKPLGNGEDVVRSAKKCFDALSPETKEFFSVMLEGELMDLLSTEGKSGGGYCTSLGKYQVPFIFTNFNGTQHDVEVMAHESGHAFASYMNRARMPQQYIWPSLEACEVHSMSMEFFAEGWAEDFFGKDADKFRYSHLIGALKFIPYGTMVDHFQHEIYANPDMTPRQRHDTWKKLLGIYMPWLLLDGDIPFYAEGEGWQRQQHIYTSPFYYIDYCLAQTVSLQFWAMLQTDPQKAWDHYLRYTKLGGSRTFTELLSEAGLESPFDENTIQSVCRQAAAWLENYDTSKLS